MVSQFLNLGIEGKEFFILDARTIMLSVVA